MAGKLDITGASMIDPEDDDTLDAARMAAANQAGSRRPKDSAFKQQSLRAWKPVLTPSNVIPTFLGAGVVFSIIGGALLGATNEAAVYSVDYTNCVQLDVSGSPNPTGRSCADVLSDFSYVDSQQPWNRCECEVEVKLSGFSGKETFLYYGLTDYYQNQRRYANSRDDLQLRSLTAAGTASDCFPLDAANGRYYAPCGLIANSLFNDTIMLMKQNDERVNLEGSGIALKSDLDVKFANPPASPDGSLCGASAWVNTSAQRPPNWWISACELGTEVNTTPMCNFATQNNSASGCAYNPWSPAFGSSGVGYRNEDFIVWMRTAILPNFKKLWRRIPGGLSDGVYKARIGYNYPVAGFKGTKSLVFGTTTSLGGKSTFLPAVYLSFGLLMLTAGGVFVAMWKSTYYGIRVADNRSIQISSVASNVAYSGSSFEME